MDLVCYRPFSDGREALPVFFLQCASGKNWRDKVHSPSATSWAKWLNAAVQPSTGIVAPFVIDDVELRQSALEGQTIVFDRVRIVGALQEDNILVLDDILLNELIDWMSPRVADLPKAS